MLVWLLFADLTSVCHLCSLSIIWITPPLIVFLIVGIVFSVYRTCYRLFMDVTFSFTAGDENCASIWTFGWVQCKPVAFIMDHWKWNDLNNYGVAGTSGLGFSDIFLDDMISNTYVLILCVKLGFMLLLLLPKLLQRLPFPMLWVVDLGDRF